MTQNSPTPSEQRPTAVACSDGSAARSAAESLLRQIAAYRNRRDELSAQGICTMSIFSCNEVQVELVAKMLVPPNGTAMRQLNEKDKHE